MALNQKKFNYITMNKRVGNIKFTDGTVVQYVGSNSRVRVTPDSGLSTLDS